MSVVGIWSGKNVLKHALINPDTMGKPDTSDGALGFYSTKVIVHNLNRIPLVRVHYDPNNDGNIFPAIGQGQAVTSNTSPLAAVVPFWLYVDDVTTTSIVLRTYNSLVLAGTFPFYYRIYRDPAV